jgi:hypothetical protein
VKIAGLVFATAVGILGAAGAAWGQSRPLVTEDPETVPAGHVLIEGGLDYAHSVDLPASGLSGNLWRIGVLGASVGVGPFAEIQIDGGLRQRLAIKDRDTDAPLAPLLGEGNPPSGLAGNSTSDFIDLRVGTKLRLAAETATRPAIAARFATRLPWADPETGLGAGTMDFTAGVAVGKTVRSIRIVVNLGLGSAGDAVEGHRGHTIVDYGGSLARAVRSGIEVVGELAGRAVGDETPGAPPESTMIRLGGRITQGPVRVDAGVALGLNDDDPTWGFTLGATWVFRAFNP